MKTIYNTYVVMESQEQCDRMKQLCIDNDLPIWNYNCAFDFDNNNDVFSFEIESKDFFIYPFEYNEEDFKNKNQVTEQEFINLLKKHNENTLEKTK